MKTYDFRISMYRAEYSERGGHKYQAIIFDGLGLGTTDFTGTLADAVAKRAQISAGETRPHALFLGMRNRNDRKATGLSKVETVVYGGEGA